MSAVWEIDLEAFAANLRAIRERVAPATHMLVVKDDAYRHGLAQIVARAVAEGIEWIGALDVSTAVAARAVAGHDARIFAWLADGTEDIESALDAELDLGVGTEALLEAVAALAAARRGTARVHLKIDTGLHRNGVRPERWEAFVERARALEAAGAVDVVGIWTHIGEASDAEDDLQREAFDRAVDQARAAGLTPQLLHVAASAAAFARPEFRYDMVRIGAFAYGIRSAGGPTEQELGLRRVGALRAQVVRVGDAGARADIGASAGLPTSVAGQITAATPAGSSVVDQVHLETLLLRPWAGQAVGDEVTLFGRGGIDSATDIAERIGTIGEELVLRISDEVPRRFV